MSSSASVAFATLFVGMVSGVQPVVLNVDGPVAEIRLQLDGREATRILGPPWRTAIDVGKELAPMELTAVGLDDLGAEVASSSQRLNVPRPPAELEIHLERDPDGQARGARLAWGGLAGGRPSALRATLDGRPLPVDASGRITMPGPERGRGHLLAAEIEFPGGARASAAAVVGIPETGQAAGALTAVPVRLKQRQSAIGAILAGGRPARIAAVETGPAEVVVVRPLSAQAARAAVTKKQTALGSRVSAEPSRTDFTVADARLRIVWPVGRRSAASYPGVTADAVLFEMTDALESSDGGLYTLLTGATHPLEAAEPPFRWADSVAMAGQAAYSCGCRRAVLLVLSSDSPDAGRHPPERVERYLERLRVPLRVWSLERPKPLAASGWSTVEDASSLSAFRSALKRLEKEIQSQSIVWIEGDWMPQEISLAPGAEGIELVR